MTTDICVIVPTVRNYGVLQNYVENAQKHGLDLNGLEFLLITEDFCDKVSMKKLFMDLGVQCKVFGQTERQRWFKENNVAEFSKLIPEKSHAETSFGLLYMQSNPNFKYGFFIDDDTLPIKDDYFGKHLTNLEFSDVVDFIGSDKKWVNVLHHGFSRHKLYPRGYPYSCTGEKTTVEKKYAKNVVISQGLWTNVPDLDAVRILMDGDLQGQAKTRLKEADFGEDFVVVPSNFTTICSMNLAFKREIIPAFYQLPMDDNPWKIGRFDDIWSGVLAKKACDLLGKTVYVGGPLCQHNKAPRNTFKDISAEAPAMDINENLWKIIDSIKSSTDYYDAYSQFTLAIKNRQIKCINDDFLDYCAKQMSAWVDCCHKLER